MDRRVGMGFSGSGVEHSNGPSQTVNVIGGSGGGGAVPSALQVEHPPPHIHPGVSVAVAAPVTPGESAKKKRGRPRKYALDGTLLSLALSPLSAAGGANMSSALSPLSGAASSGGATPSETKSTRGRPPGTGWKQQLAPFGEWMNNSAGLAFTPHFILVNPTEDVTTKILSFAQQRGRALCILSAGGSVSAVTLRQASGSVTYEGRYDIISLQGSYLVEPAGGPRTGGISISMSTPDGQVIGGAVGGRIIAENEVKVVAFSFVHGGQPKNKNEATENGGKSFAPRGEKSSTPVTTVPNSSTADQPRSVITAIDMKQERSSFGV